MLKDLQMLISSEPFINVITLLFPLITTYFIAKYNLNNPLKLKVKQQQFDNIYLPIYKLIYKDINKPISKKIALKYSIRIKNILYTNYEFAFPQLHKLNDSLLCSIKNNNDNYQVLFNKICYQVSVDYSLLSKALGYPSENSYELFKRMKSKDKLKFLLEWGSIIYMFSFPLLWSVFFDEIKLYPFILTFTFTVFLLLCLQTLITKMPD